MNPNETLIYLTACAVTGTAPVLEQTDFEGLWEVAAHHNLTALTAKTLQSTAAFRQASAEEQKRWNGKLNSSIKKTMLFNAERKKVLAFLEQNGIWYMPLKGAIINDLYPSFGTREFADNDILFDESFRDEVSAFMLDKGYTRGGVENADDSYHKDPFYNFEMHRMLFFDRDTPACFIEYYQNVKDRLLKDSGNNCGYHFSDDDFYIYFINHLFKHYQAEGTGFRSMADEYIILHCGKFRFDFAHIEQELERTGAKDFEKQLRLLTDKLLGDPAATVQTLHTLSAQEVKLLDAFIASGTFGSKENRIKNEMERVSGSEKPSKFKYYRKRIFPDPIRFKYSHPFVYKHKIVYPFFLLGRLVVNPIRHRKTLKEEWDAVNKASQEKD